ncbi:MAG: glycine cleavage system aminomethyltransferase GcvT, partial [Treponemataceae bacterium]
MRTTALHELHAAAGARFAPFAGYDMPIQYPRGAIEEHKLTRRSVGLFDIDHMGQILVEGPGSGEALSGLASNRILDMGVNQARYALLLNEKGGVMDDLFIYRLGAESWFVVANASNREADYDYLRAGIPASIDVTDVSDATYMIAVQGPRAVELLDALSLGAISQMPRFSMKKVVLAGVNARVGRTGYTGEDGAELFYPADQAAELWGKILNRAAELGIEAAPIGLAARDSLRFEAGMPLHGHEISSEITPLEASLSWACDFEKDFVGKDALIRLKAAGLTRKLATLSVTGGVPREGYEVTDTEGLSVGA